MIGHTFPTIPVVPYKDARDLLRDGDVLLCSGSGTFSSMIQAATNSPWSHVGLIIRLDGLGLVMLLESVEPIGVRTVRLSKYLTDYDGQFNQYPGGMVVLRHKGFADIVTPVWLKEGTRIAIDQFGRPYDKAAIARIAGRIMASRIPFGPEQLAKIEQDNDFICSEYVGMFFEHLGLPILWNRMGFLAPADFAEDDNFELVCVLKPKPIH